MPALRLHQSAGGSVSFPITVHFDNSPGFPNPYLWVWYDGAVQQDDLPPTGADGFGPRFDVIGRRPTFGFTFKNGPGTGGPWEGVDRRYLPIGAATPDGAEVWARGNQAFAYAAVPATPESLTAAEYLTQLNTKAGLRPCSYLPASGGLSGLGATVLANGQILFGLYHPTAAQVYLVGDFNDWQSPGHGQPDPGRFIPLRLYRGYGGLPNTWLTATDQAHVGDSYRFFVVGGVPRDAQGREFRNSIDPYSRCLNADFTRNDSVVIDPTHFAWADANWRTPDPADLVLYELSVAGFTQGDPDIDPAHQARFAGITERLSGGYFERLGVSALSLMPLAEVPSPQGPTSLGYDPSLFMTVERDFGSPDDLRQLVNTAHVNGLAVLVDMVFNHTSNGFNPLWQLVLNSPGDSSGGLYFNGSTRWGNRVATERPDVQSMLIDACRLFLVEYHVDGFRLDATHHDFMSHQFLARLATELHTVKPDVLLVAENLPNEPDLNRSGYDGYAQWCNQFHDKIKALLREGPFEGEQPTPDHLADAMYFSHSNFASHTNNVVNYCQSHDENSVAHEVRTTPSLDTPLAQDRKGRLGVFATLAALGQPMLFMGQEFNLDQPRNVVTVDWPADPDQHAFFRWTSAMVHLRRRYPGMRLSGYDPAGAGELAWILGPWMDDRHGGGLPAVGWRSRPSQSASDTLVVLLNFAPHDVTAELELGLPGRWVKLADIDNVDDIPPVGTNSAATGTALVSVDGRYSRFVLPSSSGFIYKWEAAL